MFVALQIMAATVSGQLTLEQYLAFVYTTFDHLTDEQAAAEITAATGRRISRSTAWRYHQEAQRLIAQACAA